MNFFEISKINPRGWNLGNSEPTVQEKSMLATLQLNNFFIDSLSIENSRFFDPTMDEPCVEGQINCSHSILLPKDESSEPYMLALSIKVSPAEKKPALDPYLIQIKVVGFFTFTGKMDESEKEKMLDLNGASILFGIARGIVVQATGSGIAGKYILPAINFVEMRNQKEQNSQAPSKPMGVPKSQTTIKDKKVRKKREKVRA